MNGNLWYEIARQRVAERQLAARQAGEARQMRAAARERRARDRAQAATVAPAIPDYAHEMFAELGDAVPAPRQGRARPTDKQPSR
jgi:hypothetical protein